MFSIRPSVLRGWCAERARGVHEEPSQSRRDPCHAAGREGQIPFVNNVFACLTVCQGLFLEVYVLFFLVSLIPTASISQMR